MSEYKIDNECVYLGLTVKLVSTSIIVPSDVRRGARIKAPSVIIYKDEALEETVTDIKAWCAKMEKFAPQVGPFGLSAFPKNKAAALKTKIREVEDTLADQMSIIETMYEDLKRQNLSEAAEQVGVLPGDDFYKEMEEAYPSLAEIKRKRRLNISVLSADPASVADLSEEIEEQIERRYKEAIFASLVPIYKVLSRIVFNLNTNKPIAPKTLSSLEKNIKDAQVKSQKMDSDFLKAYTKKILECKDMVVDSESFAKIFVFIALKEAEATNVGYMFPNPSSFLGEEVEGLKRKEIEKALQQPIVSLKDL